MTNKAEYLASTDDANVVERLVQAREQLKDCLMRGKAAIGYWQVQIHDDALTLIASQADEIERLRVTIALLKADAERYRWLRECHWSNSYLAVVANPKENVKLGTLCPSRVQLDDAIDAAMRGDTP